MSDCSKHKKHVAGIYNMENLAILIGDLHYESLTDLLIFLGKKLNTDSRNDSDAGREKLARALSIASSSIREASYAIEEAWEISKPYMKDEV